MRLISDGYEIYPPLFPRTELHRLMAQLSTEPLRRSRAGTRHMIGCNAVAYLARDPRPVDIASRWLDAEAIPFKATLFEKSPEANGLISWHQDTALPMSERRDVAGWAMIEVPRRVLHLEYAGSLVLEPGLELRAA
jgi:hypothetical protein